MTKFLTIFLTISLTFFTGPDDSPTKSCELCCKKPGDGNACTSSFELNQAPLDVPDMFSKAGTPCNNYAGYCDVFQKCREVDPAGKFTVKISEISEIQNW